MIQRIAIWISGALLLLSCSAPDPFDGYDWPEASPALWEIQSADGHQAWLLGTVHALPDGLEWRTDILDSALSRSELLVVEIADLHNSSLAAEEFSSRANSPGLPRLLDRVSAQDRAELAQLLDAAGQDEDDFTETESWAAALLLSSSVRSGDPANGVDRALIQGADHVVGLESHAQQYAVFDSLPEAEQIDLLLAIAGEAERLDPASSLEAWLTGDMDQLSQLDRTGLLEDTELREALLDQRNRNWLPAITGHIDGGDSPFIAVGAAHMLGDSGLPALLLAEGYSVSRIQ